MTGVVEVYLWGTKIGALGYEPNQTEFATFEYDKEFLKMGIEISPIHVSTKKLCIHLIILAIGHFMDYQALLQMHYQINLVTNSLTNILL